MPIVAEVALEPKQKTVSGYTNDGTKNMPCSIYTYTPKQARSFIINEFFRLTECPANLMESCGGA